MTVHEAVRNLRSAEGMSQQAFAVSLDMSIRAIANYESNRLPEFPVLFRFLEMAQARRMRQEETAIRSAIRSRIGVDPSKPFTI